MEPNILPMPAVTPTPSDLVRVGKLSEQITIKEDQMILILNLIMIIAAMIKDFPTKNKINSIIDKNRSPVMAIIFRPPNFLESITKVTIRIAKISTL